MSMVAEKILLSGSLTNTMPTAAIEMGDGHVVHSCRDCEVEVQMGSQTIAHRFFVMDIEAFDFALGTDLFVQHSQIQSMTLQAPYLLYVDHGNGRESVPLEQHVPVPDRVSECGLCELPSSIHSDEDTEHDAFFPQTCVEEVENAEYVAPLEPLLSMRVEDPVDQELDPGSRLREYVDS